MAPLRRGYTIAQKHIDNAVKKSPFQDTAKTGERHMSAPLRAATAECCRCHYIFLKPEMYQVNRSVGGGYSPSRQTIRYDKHGRRSGHSISEGYRRPGRNVIEWYCRECYDSYKKEQHDLFVDLFQKFIFVALIIGVIIFLNYKFRNEIDTENLNSPQMEMTSESYEIIGAEVDTPENVMEDYTAAMPSESQGTSMQAREEMEATELNVPDLERLETSHALKKAISKALGSGEAQRWSAYGSAGYVVVSAVEPQSGCRSLYYSIDTERPAWQSETRTVCPDER